MRLDDATRRALSLGVMALGVLALVVGGVVYAFAGAGARDVYVGLAVVLLLLAVAEAWLLFARTGERAPKAAPEEFLLADEAPVLHEDVYDVTCGRCRAAFQVTDHLQRPLVALCPVCGAEGIVPLRGPGAAAATPTEVAPPHKLVRLRCPKCGTVNEAQDAGQRPLRVACSQCGAAIGIR